MISELLFSCWIARLKVINFFKWFLNKKCNCKANVGFHVLQYFDSNIQSSYWMTAALNWLWFNLRHYIWKQYDLANNWEDCKVLIFNVMSLKETILTEFTIILLFVIMLAATSEAGVWDSEPIFQIPPSHKHLILICFRISDTTNHMIFRIFNFFSPFFFSSLKLMKNHVVWNLLIVRIKPI